MLAELLEHRNGEIARTRLRKFLGRTGIGFLNVFGLVLVFWQFIRTPLICSSSGVLVRVNSALSSAPEGVVECFPSNNHRSISIQHFRSAFWENLTGTINAELFAASKTPNSFVF